MMNGKSCLPTPEYLLKLETRNPELETDLVDH